MEAPSINIIEYSTKKISANNGKDYCVVQFNANQDLTEWVARANGYSYGTGILVGSGSLLPESEVGVFYIYSSVLDQGDKEYTITIYGKNSSGSWSDVVVLCDKSNNVLCDKDGKVIQMQRIDTDNKYTSLYSLEEINNFVGSVNDGTV